MVAKDFITNVSTTFSGAQAQVIPWQNTQKYTIKGIRQRSVPINPTTKHPYLRCQWQVPKPGANAQVMDFDGEIALRVPTEDCGEYAGAPRQVWEHILSAHLKLPRDENGKWLLEQKPDLSMLSNGLGETRYDCKWGTCRHFKATNGDPSAFAVGMHIKTHLPDVSSKSILRNKYNKDTTQNPPKTIHVSGSSVPVPAPAPAKWYTTVTDERQDAAGLPLASVLVLRNLARQMAKIEYRPSKGASTEDEMNMFANSTIMRRRRDDADHDMNNGGAYGFHEYLEDENEERTGGWVRRAFAPVKEQLYFIMAHNWSLREYMPSLCGAIAAGGG
jgi:chromatin structure-remodeling complex subunit RSC9